MEVLAVENWKTSASIIPSQHVGSYSITKRKVEALTQMGMDSVFGYDKVVFLDDVLLTVLREGSMIWVMDSPYEYYGMYELACSSKGSNILVGGLGLGLLPTILSSYNHIQKVTVIEISVEVIRMVQPYISKDIQIFKGDFLKIVPTLPDDYDTVIVDIWNQGSKRINREKIEVRKVKSKLMKYYPTAKHLYWGRWE